MKTKFLNFFINFIKANYFKNIKNKLEIGKIDKF